MRSKKSRHQRAIKHSLVDIKSNFLSNPASTKSKGRASKFNENITKISEMVSSMEDSRNSKISFDVNCIIN